MWRVVNASQNVSFPLLKACTSVGRDPDCDIAIPRPAVSRQHFIIHLRSQGCYLEDLHSRGGTYLFPGRVDDGGFGQIIGLTPLRPGDTFGHPACYLTLENDSPLVSGDWRIGNNSQAMLVALRHLGIADPARLQSFIAACHVQLSEDVTGRIDLLLAHPDRWFTAAEMARCIVAKASVDVLTDARNDELRRKLDPDLWRACADAELWVCKLLGDLWPS